MIEPQGHTPITYFLQLGPASYFLPTSGNTILYEFTNGFNE
jgi:hypothetical protein